MRTFAPRLLAAVATLVFAGTLGSCAAASAGTDPAPVTTTVAPTWADQLARADADDPMAVGDLDAPLVIVEWTDYSCPYCAMFAVDTLPTLLEEYVETGLVRYEIHDVAKLGAESLEAAVAARAAGEQGAYLEFMEAVYAASPRDGHPVFTEATLVRFAEQAGVDDLDAFRARLGAADLQSAVLESQEAAQAAGIESIPSFAIGDEYLLGARPLDDFRTVIDAQLEAAGVTP